MCDVREYLDYENCKCRKKLVDKLIDECTETIEEVKLANITTIEFHSFENESKYGSCRVYIVLMIVVLQFLLEVLFIKFITIGFWLKIISCIKFNNHKETEIW